jgi:hypothetical protein
MKRKHKSYYVVAGCALSFEDDGCLLALFKGQPAKSRRSIQKMIKSVEIGDLKICVLKSTYLSSCVAPNSKYLKLLFHMYVGYIIGYIQIFNSIFLTSECDFYIYI